ncbi:MAG TPA: histidine phosphatase family protein [Rhizobiaceae bacterium]|nr:histidine phosphatase family protein [Rhizobiaceae bacterium]
MLRLYILRHAKAAMAAPGMKDFDRELSARGVDDAQQMAKVMRAHGYGPQTIACSPSRRTLMTLEGIKPALENKPHAVDFPQALYHGDTDDYFAAIHAFNGAREGMVIGHNPNCEIVASLLCAGGEPDAIETMNRKFPTGALAVFDLAIDDWTQAKPGCGHLKAFIIPKEL